MFKIESFQHVGRFEKLLISTKYFKCLVMSNAFIGKFGEVIYICCLNWDLNIANKF